MYQNVLDLETLRFGHLLHGVFAMLAVIAAVAGYFFLYTPMVEGSGDLREQITVVHAKLRLAPAIRREHSELRERLADVIDRMRRLRTRIPREDHISQFVSQVTEAAEKDGIIIEDFDVGERIQNPGYSVREIHFTGTGKYVGICRFVNHVQALPRLTKVTGFDIHTESIGQEVYPVSLRVLVYFGLTVDSGAEDESKAGNSVAAIDGGPADA